jgi:hypothetical protein
MYRGVLQYPLIQLFLAARANRAWAYEDSSVLDLLEGRDVVETLRLDDA